VPHLSLECPPPIINFVPITDDVKEVTEGAPHPKCDCRDGWSGDHCEIRSDVFAQGGFQSYQNKQKQQGVSAMTVGGKVMFSFIIIALASVLLGIVALVYSQIKRNRGPKEKAVGITANDVGAGEIEMDGSSTFHSSSPPAAQSSNDNIAEEDDFDLTLDEEDAVAAADGDGGDQTFTISDSHDGDEEEDAEGSDTEPAIV